MNNVQKLKLNESQLKNVIRETIMNMLNESNMPEVDELWGEILNRNIATQDELQLVTDINGYSIDTLNNVIYARTGYRSLEQMDGE